VPRPPGGVRAGDAAVPLVEADAPPDAAGVLVGELVTVLDAGRLPRPPSGLDRTAETR
jgi:hypothetical protein